VKKKILIGILIAAVIAAAGYRYHEYMQKYNYGAVLICAPNEKSGKLAMDKYAYNESKLMCGGYDGGFLLGTNLNELYEMGYRIAQIIPEAEAVIYYMHKIGK
jgi:hypothetical protein